MQTSTRDIYQIVEGSVKNARNIAAKPWWKTFLAGTLGGAYIAFGGTLALLVGHGMPRLAAGNAILPQLLSGLVFPLGLTLIVILGAELFTGNNAILIPATIRKEIPKNYIWKNWCVVYVANALGTFLFLYLLVFLSGLVDTSPWREAIINIATGKTAQPFHAALLKGIGANWLVCLAIWLAQASKTTAGKMMGIWFPIMAFVTIGFEHSIANMFYIPLGMLCGANVTIVDYLIGHLLPVTIGNIIGGSLFVGIAYHLLTKEQRAN